MFNFNVEQISKALSRSHSVYVDNLRDRNEILRQDCFIRGSLAEIWFKDFFESHGFQVYSNLKNGNTDIDLSINRVINIEVKTSLIPYENFNIYEQGDLKIYVKSDEYSNDIDWHMGIQVYYHQFKKKWEQNVPNSGSDLIVEYKKLNFSCSWIPKNAAIQYLNNPLTKEKTWKYGDKNYWHCPLKIHNHNIDESVTYIKSILSE